VLSYVGTNGIVQPNYAKRVSYHVVNGRGWHKQMHRTILVKIELNQNGKH
jgi:hypothetical protein